METARSRRRGRRPVAVGLVALLAATLPGSGSAAREQQARLTPEYVCERGGADADGPSRRLRAEISGTFPESGSPHRPVRPGELTVRLTLPEAMVAELFPDGAGRVDGTAALTAKVAQRGEEAVAHWAGLTAAPESVPGDGALTLRHRGPVAPVTVETHGDLTFTVGALALELRSLPPVPPPATGGGTGGETGGGSDGGAEGETTGGTGGGQDEDGGGGTGVQPGPAAPVAARLECEPVAGERDLLLATVPVSPSPGGSPVPSPARSGARGDTAGGRPQERGADDGPITVGPATPVEVGECPAEAPDVDFDEGRLPEPPPGAVVREGTPFPLCVVPVGYATVRKQGSAMIVNDPSRKLGLMKMAYLQQTVQTPDGAYNESDSAGLVDLPDARSTFLAFDFQPVTARVEFEAGPATIVNINRGGEFTTTVGYDQTIRLHDVRVNGVPLDVGPGCRTARPFSTELSGDYNFLQGGVLEGDVDIPPFSGCGTGGEDLDPLFTAAVSGPGNRLTIRQSVPCTGATCEDYVPELPEL